MRHQHVEILSDSFKVHYRRTVCSTAMFIIFVEHLILASYVAAQGAQPSPAPSPSSPSSPPRGLSDPTVLLQIIILITTLCGFAYTIYRENRNRKWDLEDREWARQQAIRRSKRMHKHVSTVVEQVGQQVQDVSNKVDANTVLTAATAEKVEARKADPDLQTG